MSFAVLPLYYQRDQRKRSWDQPRAMAGFVTRLGFALAAFRIAATGALVAILEADQRGFAAFGALPQTRSGEPAGRLRPEIDDLRLQRPLVGAVPGRQKADLDH